MNRNASTQINNSTLNYHAYLIRLWREDEVAPWRGELISPRTGEQQLFATADQLLAFLAAQLENNAVAEQQEKAEDRT